MRHAALFIVALFVATTVLAGSSLSMRLVEASNTGGGVASSLEDVAGALRGQLPFNTYQQLAAGSTALPASGSTSQLGDYQITCSGPQNALAIKVARGRRTLINTTVNLRDGKPVLLGGFPSAGGKLIIVFKSR
jgi:hypothetical protein